MKFTLNGKAVDIEIDDGALLLDVLRGHGLTGTKEGCAVGVCGLCTVLVRDLPVSSCIYLAQMAEGADVWTVEGLTARDPRLLQAFVNEEGMQCGICTPGQVVSTYALALDLPAATDDDIRHYMAGNLCRCTGYATITDAVKAYLSRD